MSETKDAKITSLENQVVELKGKIGTLLHMDTISKNQELLTLKNDIAEALKFDYADYTILKNAPCNEDTYMACVCSLNRIFKVLKRHGIEFLNDAE